MKRFKKRSCFGFLFVLLIGFVAFTLSTHSVYARDLTGRLGLGYNNQFANSRASNSVPGVSLKYAFSRDFAAALIFGVKTGTDSNSVFGGKFFKTIFMESNLNFYGLLGVGIVRAKLGARSNSGTEMMGGFGVEFFIPGLESLGFSFETGASLDNLSGSYEFRTMGVNVLNAGIHFYF
jgi:hypothetical protein